jgi:hydrogenase maturation protease
MTGAALVIGYGNVLRSDDGLGWHVADRLHDDPRLNGATVLRQHQLTPELALEISRAAIVVLIDASHELAAGTFSANRIDPDDGSAMSWSHHLGPGGLLALAHALYGRAADCHVISVGVQSVAFGHRLSPVVEAGLPRVVDAVVDLVQSATGLALAARPDGA